MAEKSRLAERGAALRFVAPALRATQAVSPAAAAALAERLFFRVPPAKVSERGQEFLAQGKRFDLAVDGRRVVGWSWGHGPTAYLVHGWGSSSGRLYQMAEALLATSRRLVMFDAPGHGASGRGLSSMPEFARSFKAVAERVGPPEVVVAHSMGAAASTLAATWGVRASRYVFLAPTANPVEWAWAFGKMFRLTPAVMQKLRMRSEQRLRFNWDDIDARIHARGMTSPLLVIHDLEDITVPFSNGVDIVRSWPGARLVETSGLGHSDILRDQGVITRVIDFLSDSRTHEPGSHGVPPDTISAR